ncbi:RtcB family protein [Halocatena halophila]|uniref:RtcB family protein n=1 Tax=Halocatena halophila TaxID=2814576 RepID=UPI002ED64004
MKLNGKYTDATVIAEEVDNYCLEQIQELINHEAFTEPVKIMPDAHAGAGAVIGFTMPVGDKIIPNTIGVDIGCGVDAINIGSEIPNDLRELDETIRDVVPFGLMFTTIQTLILRVLRHGCL